MTTTDTGFRITGREQLALLLAYTTAHSHPLWVQHNGITAQLIRVGEDETTLVLANGDEVVVPTAEVSAKGTKLPIRVARKEQS